MVLRKSGRVGSRRFRRENPWAGMLGGSLFCWKGFLKEFVWGLREESEGVFEWRAGGDPFRVFRAFLEGRIRCIDHCGKFLFYVFPYDNGPDYPSDGLIRIVDEKGLIGYEDT